MPRTGQIIPPWFSPHEYVVINDNTVVEDAAVENIGTRFCNVFVGPKGIDNKLVENRGIVQFVDEFGLPDYRNWGQAMYMPYASLSTGAARSWSMRCMPENAAYANNFIVVGLKVDETDPQKKKMRVKFMPLTQTGLTSLDELDTYMETQVKRTPDANGWVYFPLLGTASLGRGKYGGFYRVRLLHNTADDQETTFKNYFFELISTEYSAKKLETYRTSFYIDAIDKEKRSTLYIEDIVNDYEGDGSKRIQVNFMYKYYEEMFNFYKTNVDPTTHLTVASFDIFGFDKVNNVDNPNIVIEGGLSSIGIFNLEGLKLDSGTDGDLDISVDKALREKTIDQLYTKAFNGGLDPKIKSKVRAPMDVILDANGSLENKKALANLVLTRFDCRGYLDSGLLSTVNEVKSFTTSLIDINSYLISKDMGMMRVKDPITNKVIPVTMTCWLASKIPNHWRTYGKHVAMAAEDYARISGYEKNSIKPALDIDDMETKDFFYLLRWNYPECTAENVYVRGTQQTSQKELSDLSEESNVFMLLEFKRRLEYECSKKRYKFAEASDRRLFAANAKEIFSSWIGTKVRSIDVDFKMSKFEELRSILHCYGAIVFKTIGKRSIIEIDVNPRA